MAERRFQGRRGSPGFAAGPLVRLAEGVERRRASGDPAEEERALQQAVQTALTQLEDLLARSQGEGADILAFQVAMLEDAELGAQAFLAIAQGAAAESAWASALDQEISGYEQADNEHFQARASDLRDIRDRVLRALAGAGEDTRPPRGAIVVAHDLTPSRFLAADWSAGGGIALTGGSASGHLATLARARGVPMVVGLGLELGRGEEGAPGLIDGEGGVVWIDPTPTTRVAFEARAAASGRAAREADEFRLRPAVTADGVVVRVLLNVASPDELEGIDPAGCDGIGLVRTEFLFESGAAPPDEETQYQAYRKIAQWAGDRPVTIRTLDAGADKPIPGLTLERETNPFLGLRGIRLSLTRPDVFRVQLRALCRAAAHGAIEIMLPMVAIPEEIIEAGRLLDEEFARLRREGLPARRPPLGIMVETPAAAIAIDTLDAAFYSIGSNDLTQYVMAAARDSAAVANLYDPSRPAVLRLIASVAAHGVRSGRKVSLCGDAAGDPQYSKALLDAGLRVLSMAPAAVARTKQAIAAVDLSGAG